MSEELIKSISQVLSEWNPLGKKAESISDLEGYICEATDILSVIRILKEPVEKAVSDVITQAFGIELSEAELKHYSFKIEQLISVQ